MVKIQPSSVAATAAAITAEETAIKQGVNELRPLLDSAASNGQAMQDALSTLKSLKGRAVVLKETLPVAQENIPADQFVALQKGLGLLTTQLDSLEVQAQGIHLASAFTHLAGNLDYYQRQPKEDAVESIEPHRTMVDGMLKEVDLLLSKGPANPTELRTLQASLKEELTKTDDVLAKFKQPAPQSRWWRLW